MPSNNSFLKPFVAGAITALSTAFLVQQLRKHKVRRRRRKKKNTNAIMDSIDLDQRMIRKAEAVIRGRTSRLTIVVERCTNSHNYSAILRTAEALGVQHVSIIAPPAPPPSDQVVSSTGKVLKKVSEAEVESRTMHHLFAQNATEWITVREFDDTASCLDQLRRTGHTIWATDLSQEAVCLSHEGLDNAGKSIPEKLAIVFGTEAVGCTQELLDAADLRVYLPLRGWADSLNLSVATALVLQQLFWLDPTLVGSMSEAERRQLRKSWFAKLATQRLLKPSEKRHRARLTAKLNKAQRIKDQIDRGEQVQPEQVEKVKAMASMQAELNEIDVRLQQEAAVAVKDLVEDPPEPLSDMRRADQHRICFVGKNTKRKSQWDNMPATTGYDTTNVASTADYFRSRAAASQKAT